MKIKVGVIFGGPSVEHEVSVISAIQAMNNIDIDKYDIVPIYITKEGTWYTGNILKDIENYKNMDIIKKYAKKVSLIRNDNRFILQKVRGLFREVDDIDVAFPIVHGYGVEDGTLAGYLSTIGIPYVGSNTLGGAIAQDKVVMKQVFAATKLPIVDYTWFYDSEYNLNHTQILKDVKKIGYPVIVKPASLGSSVGISYVKDADELDKSIKDAIQYDNKIVVEKAVPNLLEVNCSVVGNYEFQDTSAIEEVMSHNDFLTYADKYEGKGKTKGMASASRIIPANISEDMTKKVEEISKSAFKAVNLSGVARIDFLINNKTKEIYINEINSIPGSLSFYLWTPKGKKYSQLLDELITLAIKDYKNKENKVNSFDTNLLNNFKHNGMKGIKK
jgi:D-alanine-D-alanine ligase